MILTLILSFAVDSLQIKESTVVSDRVSKEVPAQVLQGTQLQSLSTTSVADALKFFAGVQIKDYGGLGGQKTINVRSLGTQHTGVYIDGIRITNCQNGTVDLSKYSLTNMEAVELYNANKISSLMSASEYASASTVYFTTKQPSKPPYRPLTSMVLSIRTRHPYTSTTKSTCHWMPKQGIPTANISFITSRSMRTLQARGTILTSLT